MTRIHVKKPSKNKLIPRQHDWRRPMPKQEWNLERSQKSLKRLWKSLCIGICALMMMACGRSTPLLPDRSPLPPNLLTACPTLSNLENGSKAAVLRKFVDVGQLYHECRQRHDALINAVQPGPLSVPDDSVK